MGMGCPECGTGAPPRARFCGHCGAALAPAAPSPGVPGRPPAPSGRLPRGLPPTSGVHTDGSRSPPGARRPGPPPRPMGRPPASSPAGSARPEDPSSTATGRGDPSARRGPTALAVLAVTALLAAVTGWLTDTAEPGDGGVALPTPAGAAPATVPARPGTGAERPATAAGGRAPTSPVRVRWCTPAGASGFAGSPVVAGHRVVAPVPHGLRGYDRRGGALVWERFLDNAAPGLAAAEGTVVVLSGDRLRGDARPAEVQILEAASGAIRSRVGLTGHPVGVPLLAAGRVTVATADGALLTADLQAGRPAWRRGDLPSPLRPGAASPEIVAVVTRAGPVPRTATHGGDIEPSPHGAATAGEPGPGAAEGAPTPATGRLAGPGAVALVGYGLADGSGRWRLPLATDPQPRGRPLVRAGGTLWMRAALGQGPHRLLGVHLATGAVVASREVRGRPLAAAGGTVFLDTDLRRSADGEVVGSELSAVETTTGVVRWRARYTADLRAVHPAGQRLAVTVGDALFVLDAASGERVWGPWMGAEVGLHPATSAADTLYVTTESDLCALELEAGG